MTDAIPRGWYPDPAGGDDERWWDGANWTDHARPSVRSDPGAAHLADERPRRRGWPLPVALGVVVLLAGGTAWWVLDARLGDQESQLAALESDLAERDDEIATLEDAVAERDDDIAARDASIAELQAELREAHEELDRPGTDESSDIGADIVAGDFRFSQVEVRSDFVEDFEIRARMTYEGTRSPDYVDITATIFDENDRILAVLTGTEFGISPDRPVTVTLTGLDDYTTDWASLEIAVDYR